MAVTQDGALVGVSDGSIVGGLVTTTIDVYIIFCSG